MHLCFQHSITIVSTMLKNSYLLQIMTLESYSSIRCTKWLRIAHTLGKKAKWSLRIFFMSFVKIAVVNAWDIYSMF